MDGLTGEVTTLRGDHTHLCKSLEDAPDDVKERFKGELSKRVFVSDFIVVVVSCGILIMRRL